jgi:DNA topoisomerase-3
MEDYAREIVDVAKNFEYDEVYGGLPALGKCPNCARDVYEQAWFYRCEEKPERDPDCPVRFWKDTSGRYLDRMTVAALIRDGKSPTVDGFTARDGRTYKGHLELDRDTWKVLVRSEGFSGEGESAQPEYEVNPEPLGRCPLCEDQDVVETPTQFACAGRLKAQEEDAQRKAERQAAGGKRLTPAERAAEPKPCGFVLPRTVCKREITREEALHYLKNGRTELLTDFTSRFGRPFSAILFLKENGRHGFEFPPRGQAAEKAAGAEGEAAKPAPARARRGRAAAKVDGAEEAAPAAPRKPARAPRRGTGERAVARRAASPKSARRPRNASRKSGGKSGSAGSDS